MREKLIKKAKERLSATPLIINEIAFELGFAPSILQQAFKESLLEYRKSFN